MGKCFVIQPFDRGRFDKRYDDVFAPAIRDADLQPYRVDRDPSVRIPIIDIEKGIRDSDICFADITSDNPNVWFELGYAIASQKDVVLVCSEERTNKFPFDIQHRNIIQYTTQSSSDFSALGKSITDRLKALLEKEKNIADIASSSPLAETEGLSTHEMVALVTIMQNQFSDESWVASYQIKDDMNKVGFTDLAVSLSLRSLLRKEFLKSFTDHDINGNPFASHRITEKGADWLLQNQEKLVLKQPNPDERRIDDLPF